MASKPLFPLPLVDAGPVGAQITKLEQLCRAERARSSFKDSFDVMDDHVPDEATTDEVMRRMRIGGWRIDFNEWTVAGDGRAGVFYMTPPRGWE